MTYDSFTLPWTITLRHEGVFVAEIDCDLEGTWSKSSDDFEFEVDSLVLTEKKKSVRLHRPREFEKTKSPLARLLFLALDANWDALWDRVFDLSQQ